MQAENSAMQGSQSVGGAPCHGVGGAGGGGEGGSHGQRIGMRGGIGRGGLGMFGPGADPLRLALPSSNTTYSSPYRRNRQAFSMYEPVEPPGPTAHGPPAMDSLASRLQPLNTPSVS